MIPTEEIITGTLRWCNVIRSDKGQELLEELPKGKRFDPRSCPCGKATGLFVGYQNYQEFADGGEDDEVTLFMANDEVVTVKRETIWLPWEVREFTRLFDNGHMPEFDEEYV